MKRWTIALALAGVTFMDLAGAAGADDEAEWRRALLIPCSPLLTAEECRMHQDTMRVLPEGPEQARYLAEHVKLLEERLGNCECGLTRQTLGLVSPAP